MPRESIFNEVNRQAIRRAFSLMPTTPRGAGGTLIDLLFEVEGRIVEAERLLEQKGAAAVAELEKQNAALSARVEHLELLVQELHAKPEPEPEPAADPFPEDQPATAPETPAG